MKKLAFLLLALTIPSLCGADWFDNNMASDPFNSNATTAGITVSQPGSGKRLCVTDLSVSANNAMVFSIISGSLTASTTYYSIAVTSGIPSIEQWDAYNPMCILVNSTLTVTASPIGAGYPIGTIYKINIAGYTKSR